MCREYNMAVYMCNVPTQHFLPKWLQWWFCLCNGEHIFNKSLKKLKPRKSPGPDGIHNEMLTHLCTEAKIILLSIINITWQKGELPSTWKTAIVKPILKKCFLSAISYFHYITVDLIGLPKWIWFYLKRSVHQIRSRHSHGDQLRITSMKRSLCME